MYARYRVHIYMDAVYTPFRENAVHKHFMKTKIKATTVYMMRQLLLLCNTVHSRITYNSTTP